MKDKQHKENRDDAVPYLTGGIGKKSTRSLVLKPVSVIISEESIRRWHIFALESRQKKAKALEEIIKRGTKK